jgi:hypothetical protein
LEISSWIAFIFSGIPIMRYYYRWLKYLPFYVQDNMAIPNDLTF